MKSIHHLESPKLSKHKAKKLKSDMVKSRSTSWQGLNFPIERDVRFKCEDKFLIKKINQQLHNCSMQIQQSLNPSISTQTQRLKNAMFVLKPSFKIVYSTKLS